MAELHPDAADVVARTYAAGAPPLQTLTPEQARAAHEAGAAFLSGPGDERVQAFDGDVAGVPCRSYEPPDADGTVVYVHGGGWVVGTLDTYDTLCRALAVASGATVVSVGYSLAPEARYPRQVEEVVAVLRALAGDAEGPLAVAGDSAGGQLVLLAAAAAGVPLAGLGVVYPCVHPALDTASARENATGKVLETEGMRWYWEHYLGEAGADALPAGAAPGLPSLEGLPPTWLVLAGHDPLHDEGVLVRDALAAAGVPVVVEDHDDQIHGFLRMTAANAAALPTLGRLGAFLRERLDA